MNEQTNNDVMNKKIDGLLKEIRPMYFISKQRKEERRSRGEAFNVFNVIGLWSEEVRLHSAFIAELLNPKGSHGMGDKFLKAFLELIDKDEEFIDSSKVSNDMVERYVGRKTETEGGRIDIIVEDGTNALIIENKIYARDQENQLLRYQNYAKKKFKGESALVYLTLDGHEPSEEPTQREVDFIYLSYEKDMINWLTKCSQLAYNRPLVRETIQQYIHLIRQLTNQDMDENILKEVAKKALDDLEAVYILNEAHVEISRLLREDYIIKPLKAYAEEKGFELEVKSKERNPSIQFKKKEWTTWIAIEADNKRGNNYTWRNMFIGIKPEKTTKDHVKLDCLKEQPTEYWAYGWEWLPISSWHSTSSYVAMKNQEVTNWIIAKIEAIVKEIEEKQIII